MALGSLRPIGARRHWVRVLAAGPVVGDGDGAPVPAPIDRGDWAVEIRAATTADLERYAAGTIIADATHILIGRYHPDVTPTSALDFRGRTFHVAGVRTVQELDTETIAICREVL